MSSRKRKKKLRTSELEGKEATVLPAREALSLISTDPLSDYDVGDMALTDPSGGALVAQDAATPLPDTHADAAGGGESSVTSADRSEHITRTDSASSKT